MDADRYQRAALATWKPEPATTPHGRIIDLLYNGGQLSSEAGEINGLIAKWAKYGAPLDANDLRDDLGDLLWHLATLADLAGLTLSEIMQANLAKLRARHGDRAPDLWYQRQREAAQAVGLLEETAAPRTGHPHRAETETLAAGTVGAGWAIHGDTWTPKTEDLARITPWPTEDNYTLHDSTAPAPMTGRATDGV